MSSTSIIVGEWLQRQGHFWVWPLYILFKSYGRHRMHCLVFTDTDLYSLTKGKAYLANQRWRRSTCLRDQWYDVGCHPWKTRIPRIRGVSWQNRSQTRQIYQINILWWRIYFRERCKSQNINPISPTPKFNLGIIQIIIKNIKWLWSGNTILIPLKACQLLQLLLVLTVFQ